MHSGEIVHINLFTWMNSTDLDWNYLSCVYVFHWRETLEDYTLKPIVQVWGIRFLMISAVLQHKRSVAIVEIVTEAAEVL